MKVVAPINRVPGNLKNLTGSHRDFLLLQSQLHDITCAQRTRKTHPDKVSADDLGGVGQYYAQREEVFADS